MLRGQHSTAQQNNAAEGDECISAIVISYYSLWHNNVVKTQNINSFEIILQRHKFRHIFSVSQKHWNRGESALHPIVSIIGKSSKHHDAGLSQMLSAQYSSSNTKTSYILLESLAFFSKAISAFYKAQNKLYQLYNPKPPSSMWTAWSQIS